MCIEHKGNTKEENNGYVILKGTIPGPEPEFVNV
jgi:hypothetical protein